MFFRTKTSGPRTYLQVVENRWEDGRSRQRVVATLGRLDQLQQSGQLDALLALRRPPGRSRSCSSPRTPRAGSRPSPTRHIGPALVFQRLWQQTGCQHVDPATPEGTPLRVRRRAGRLPHRPAPALRPRQRPRRRQVEEGLPDRGLRRLCNSTTSTGPWPGSATSCPQGAGGQDAVRSPLHQGPDRGGDSSPTAATCSPSSNWSSSTPPRSTSRARAAETIGQRGHSKDHRPDLKQMIVGAVLDGQGRPICCELWPGNTADVTTLIPVVDRLRSRFGVSKVCIVADRGMISKETIAALEKDRAGLAVHPGRPDAVAERGEGRGAGPGRSLSGRASRRVRRATTPRR